MSKNQHKGTGLVRIGAWIALAWERLWPLLVPLFLVGIIFFSVSWLGMWEHLPPWLHISLMAVFVIAALGALSFLGRFIMPRGQEISRRIEVETQLEDRPISALEDDIALGEGDAFSRALWNEHRTRMGDRLNNLTSGNPKASGDRFDPYGLRLILPILAFVAFMVSLGANGGKLSDAFRLGGDPTKLLTRLDVWVNPPAYTQKPPLYLALVGEHQAGKSLLVPHSSELVGRFVGQGEISLRFDDGENQSEIVAKVLGGDGKGQERNFSFKLNQSGVVSVFSRSTKIAQWSLQVIEDQIPRINFEENPSAALSGSLQLKFNVKDDYGVARAVGTIAPATQSQVKFSQDKPARFVPPSNARSLIKSLEIKLPLPRRRAKLGSAKLNRDLSKHPLAGSKVAMVLSAYDDAGQKGVSETKEFILPGRNFSDPIAKALIEQRRILALDANQRGFVLSMLDAVSTAPEKFIDNYATHLALKVSYRKLADARSDDDLRDVMDLLWETAMGIEFGKMSDVERRLREAQERLSEALENGAGEKEISKLMQELRQAMNEMMQALAEQARKNPQNQTELSQNDQSRTLTKKDLERMLDRIEDLMRSGSKDAARQLLSEMQRMMDNLRSGRHQQQRRAEGNAENKALNELSELMQKQRQLMDETSRMNRQPRSGDNQNNQNKNGPSPRSDQPQTGENQPQENGEQQQGKGQNQQMTEKEIADAMEKLRQQQEGLQQELSELNQQLKELGLSPNDDFNEAGKQMGEAGKKLGQGKAGKAAGNQAQALGALQRGAQSLMQQMAGDRQQGGQQQGNGQANDNHRRMARDPLGRGRNNQGSDFGDDTKIPGEIDAQRAREILEAIRKRLSGSEQRVIEKKYLERLLDNR